MNIAIDVSPLFNAHKYRGIGSYTQNLVASVKEYDKTNNYYEVKSINEVKKQNDIVICPYFDPFNLSLPLIRTNKFIITIHDLIPLKFSKHFPVGFKGRLVWDIQRLMLKSIDIIITDSLVSKSDIEVLTSISKNKIFVVYPPVDSIFKPISNKFFLSDIISKYQLPDKFILYVGDCNWNKNIPTLIKAVKKLNITLVLVGKVFEQKNIDINHPWNKSLKEVFDLTKKDSIVKAIGYVNSSDLVGLYNLASLYVQPSYYEGFGLSVVEALSCGCPVLSSIGGSLMEVGGKSVDYFNSENLSELITKINTLLNDRDLKKRGLSKRLKQAGLFTPRKFVQNLNEIYQKFF